MKLLHLLTSTTTYSGARYHRLKCGHLVRTAFSLWAPSPCASNCASYRKPCSSTPSSTTSCSPTSSTTNRSPPTSTPFLCPTCYESYLHRQLLSFKLDILQVAHSTGKPLGMVLEQVKGKFDTGAKAWKDEFNNWYGVETGAVRYTDVVKESYGYMVAKKGERECKGFGKSDVSHDGGVGRPI